jgi:hypothetical protein
VDDGTPPRSQIAALLETRLDLEPVSERGRISSEIERDERDTVLAPLRAVAPASCSRTRVEVASVGRKIAPIVVPPRP